MNGLTALTFSSSNWMESPKRFNADFARIQETYRFFDRALVWNEANLGRAYHDRFSRYYDDAGFAYWSWKPAAILQVLDGMKDGDCLLYLDGGCVLPMDRIEPFLYELDQLQKDFVASDCRISLTSGAPIPDELIVRREILEKFGLWDNEFFRKKYPHWQAGVLLLRKDVWTLKFIQRWYDFFDANYETLIHTPFEDKTGQIEGFIHNGGDQAILQCMMFTEQVKAHRMNYLTDKYAFYCRNRG